MPCSLFLTVYQGNMYVFGGEFTASNETPLWTFNFREYNVLSTVRSTAFFVFEF